jgi:hypothetical protein
MTRARIFRRTDACRGFMGKRRRSPPCMRGIQLAIMSTFLNCGRCELCAIRLSISEGSEIES